MVVDIDKWTTYYYLAPRSEEAPMTLKENSKQKLLANNPRSSGIVGFWAELFSANSDQVEAWVVPHIGGYGSEVLCLALWHANTPQSKAALKSFLGGATREGSAVIGSLLSKEPPDVGSKQIEDPMELDFLWGRFMGSGDQKYVSRIVDQLAFRSATEDRSGLGILNSSISGVSA